MHGSHNIMYTSQNGILNIAFHMNNTVIVIDRIEAKYFILKGFAAVVIDVYGKSINLLIVYLCIFR